MTYSSDTEVLILHPSRWFWLSIAVGSVLFVIGTLWALAADLISASPWFLWVPMTFFCAAVGVLTAVCALLALTGELRLDPEGFTLANAFMSYRYRWSDVTAPFSVIRIGIIRMVGMDIRAERLGGKFMKAFANYNRRECGASGALLAQCYGVSAIDLATLLNRWRTRDIARASTNTTTSG